MILYKGHRIEFDRNGMVYRIVDADGERGAYATLAAAKRDITRVRNECFSKAATRQWAREFHDETA